MNINRNNYEEYFLLYADKELSADEKSMVEMFIQQNPDLEEEFIMLQQSVIKPDNNITLEDKSSLLRKEEFINENNYEEKFLLYTDNELRSSEIEETEKFVSANPFLQHEFNLLQKATYEPDTSIVFPDKNLLYKKEDEKVIPFRWKYLAAAILLGIGLWTGITYMQKNNIKPVVAVKQNTPKENTPVKVNEPKESVKNSLVKANNNQTTPVHKKIQNDLDHPLQKQPQQNITVKNIQPADKKPEAPKTIDKKKEVITVMEVPNKNEATKLTNILPQGNTLSEPNDRTLTKATPLQNNNYAQHASYIEEAEVKNENYVFYNITAEEFRKSKVGNFLKKVKRAIERKIPVKNNILKIGTAEIAKDDQN